MMINTLPRKTSDVDIVRAEHFVRNEMGSNEFSQKSFRVSRSKVVTALHWSKMNNPEHVDIVIDESSLEWIASSDVGYLDVTTMFTQSEDDEVDPTEDLGPTPTTHIPEHTDTVATGFIDNGGHCHLSEDDEHMNSKLQTSVAHSKNKQNVSMSWPSMSEKPVNEFGDTRIFARAFPWLFPGGLGDPKDFPQSVGEWGSLMPHCEDCRFSTDKTFPFFALNCVMPQAGGFLLRSFSGTVQKVSMN